MSISFRIISLILFAAITGSVAQAQGTDSGVPSARLSLITRADADSVVLRWGVSTPAGWTAGNRNGYIVERIKLAPDGSFAEGSFERLTAAPLKPWTLDEWKKRVTPDNRQAAVAAQMLYGKNTPTPSRGGELGAYQQEAKIQNARHGVAHLAADNDAMAAEGLALRFVDRNVRSGDRFAYRVFQQREGRQAAADTAYAVVTAEQFVRTAAPFEPQATGLDGRVVLSWEKRLPIPFTGFNVERSSDGGSTYTRLNRAPVVPTVTTDAMESGRLSYEDSSVVNYRVYQYRITGITPFGETSQPAIVTASGRDMTPSVPPAISTPKQTGTRSVKITWTLPAASPDLAGFMILRADSGASNFHTLLRSPLPPTAREFTDDRASEAEPNYIVASVDTAGNMARSLTGYAVIVDSTPPATPTGLTATIDTNGVVRLKWNLGDEPNLMGYRIMKANDPSHTFSVITQKPCFDTTYTDTVSLNVLTKYLYYKVVAENSRYIRSAPTAMVPVLRPDIVPPAASVFRSVDVDDKSVTLSWVPGGSHDLMKQTLDRRLQGDSIWKIVAELPKSGKNYVDRDVTAAVTYEYRITTVDSAGLKTGSAPVQARPYENGLRPAVTSLKAEYNVGKKSVLLRWDYGKSVQGGYRFMVYRGRDAGNMTQYQAFDQSEHAFEDNQLAGAGTYVYAIRVLADGGAQSPMSEQARVVVQ